MQITMTSAALPIFTTYLGNLSHLLDKAQASAQARKFDGAVLVTARLAPDMLALASQVQIACDGPKNGVARIAGIEAPRFEDSEKTLPELNARIARTLDWLGTVPAGALDGSEDKDITFPVGREATRTMKGKDYLTLWVLPNFFFHVTTAYAILRHNGVDIGKADYLRGAQARQ